MHLSQSAKSLRMSSVVVAFKDRRERNQVKIFITKKIVGTNFACYSGEKMFYNFSLCSKIFFVYICPHE